MNTHNAAILATRLSRHFGTTRAVDELSLEVPVGTIFGCLGHNGAGKTTTVRLLNGVLAPTGGSAQVLGLDPTTAGSVLRHRTGVLTETPSLEERLTARENLEIYADLYGLPKAEVDQRVTELLEMFELGDRAAEKVGGYSRGMKQRLALARALIHRPELLFLDEPTSGLDPVAARQVNDLILRLSRREGRTVFLCTHNLVEAQQLCDQVAVLEHGRLVALGTPRELIQQAAPRVPVAIEVNPQDVTKATAAATGPDGSGLEHQGDGLFTAHLGREDIPDALKALVTAGVRVYRVMPQEPSLEDVYFALHEKETER